MFQAPVLPCLLVSSLAQLSANLSFGPRARQVWRNASARKGGFVNAVALPSASCSRRSLSFPLRLALLFINAQPPAPISLANTRSLAWQRVCGLFLFFHVAIESTPYP